MRIRAAVLLGVTVSAAGVLAGCAPSIPAPCDTAMAIAAREETASDVAILATLDECVAADDWIAALQKHPGAGSLVSYTREEAIAFLDLACIRRIDAPTCIDAAEQGLLSFELDDPRLDDLQIPRD